MGIATNLSLKHLALVLITVLVWGTNFIAIYVGLQYFPPFLFCAIRFALSAFPLVFFLPKPQAPLKFILGYAVFNFAVQFGLLFTGIYLGLSPGLSSLLLQVQVFFSIGLAYLFFQEKPGLLKIFGSLISFIGIGVVAHNLNGGATLTGLVLTLLAALSWASGNMFTKKVNARSPLALVVWGNLIAFPFMAVASLLVDGPSGIESSFQNISLPAVGAVAFVVYLSTHVGYGIWGYLLKLYSTSVVVPFTLLIPVVGFLSSALFLGEDLPSWKLWASFFILLGLIVNLLEKEVRGLLKL